MREHHSPTGVLEGADPEAGLLATPLANVPALTYDQLRQLAETAVGVEDEPAQFYFIPDGTMERSEPDALLADNAVVVPTRSYGRFVRNALLLQMDDTPEPGPGYSLPAAVDAVFWSDAATQKFLFPYIASCGGDRAGEMLARVQQAWNYYPVDEVTVYALVHMTSRSLGAQEMENAIWVVFALRQTGAALTARPLSEFLQMFRPVETIEELPPPLARYQRGVPTDNQQQPDYQVLRAMAEWAASLRDAAAYFVFPAGTRGFLRPVTELGEVQSGDIVVPAYTPTVPAGRRYLGGVWLQPPGLDLVANVAERGDALFWSTASIEQFLFPYYASKGGLEALPDLEDIHRTWTEFHEFEVYGLIHLPSSEWTEITLEEMGWQPGDLPDARTDVEGSLTVQRADGRHHRVVRRVEPKRQIGVLHLDETGQLAVTRADRFIARHRGGRA